MKGRKPLPKHIHKLNGNPSRLRLDRVNEPEPRLGFPECPAHLDEAARVEWDRITRELDAMGILAHPDRAALAAYCQLWSRMVKAEGMVQKSGEVLKSEKTGTYYQNPYLGVVHRSLELMHKFLVEFGLTPISRTRIGQAGLQRKRNKLDEFIGETG